ncbi:TRAP-type C4-dicarboxylate transport system, small permease component [Chelatococcus sambhunathii]|uniref:TRAP transporter small permease protein n=1 Tax=Chelatococcus sambhunathii TaxID=363953 RepID=A0ABM9TYR7_9HYPH|nr:TRAP transporter small permease subunit [Chelatococcus sambhunathii]CUA84296.1 TRAP-type C4-dicarboxylate transport system, small permease component [Chelatococcus sambhunathii]
MRAALDRLYSLSLWLAGLCLVAIAVLVGLQVGARLLDSALRTLGLEQTGFIVPSLAEIGGFLLAAASFLALGASLKAGSHIRVTMLLALVGEARRRPMELFALGVSALASGYGTWYTAKLALDSWTFNEKSYGIVPVPLVIPQASLAIGLAILTIAILDELQETAVRGRPSFRSAEDAIAVGKEA